MKSKKQQLKTSRRAAIKILGLGSAAIVTGGFGNIYPPGAIQETRPPAPQDNFDPIDGTKPACR